MAAIDATLDQVFQEWDDKKFKLHSTPPEQQGQKFGAWAKLISQRQATFADSWRPDRMKLLKKLGKTDGATAESVRATLTPLARADFVHDLRTWGVPDQHAVAAGSLVEVK
jgi:hypothetical protein